MAEVKHAAAPAAPEVAVDRAKDFWSQYNKPIIAFLIGFVVAIGGWIGYKKFIKEPKEMKAAEALYKAEEYYRLDSLNAALKGDGQFAGLEKIAKDYGGTKAGNLARFYAGTIYLKQGDAKKAADMLDDFETDAAQVKARAQKLLADAYAEQGKNKEALEAYKKAATIFESDESSSSEYLFMAAYFADKVMKNKNEAVDLYKQVKKKYPQSQFSMQADMYLAQNGVYDTEK